MASRFGGVGVSLPLNQLGTNSFALQAAAGLDHHRTTKAVRKLIKAGAVEQRGMKRQCEYHLIITTSGQ